MNEGKKIKHKRETVILICNILYSSGSPLYGSMDACRRDCLYFCVLAKMRPAKNRTFWIMTIGICAKCVWAGCSARDSVLDSISSKCFIVVPCAGDLTQTLFILSFPVFSQNAFSHSFHKRMIDPQPFFLLTNLLRHVSFNNFNGIQRKLTKQ